MFILTNDVVVVIQFFPEYSGREHIRNGLTGLVGDDIHRFVLEAGVIHFRILPGIVQRSQEPPVISPDQFQCTKTQHGVLLEFGQEHPHESYGSEIGYPVNGTIGLTDGHPELHPTHRNNLIGLGGHLHFTNVLDELVVVLSHSREKVDLVFKITVDRVHGEVTVDIFHIRLRSVSTICIGNLNGGVSFTTVVESVTLQDSSFGLEEVLVVIPGWIPIVGKFRELGDLFRITQSIISNILVGTFLPFGVKGVDQ